MNRRRDPPGHGGGRSSSFRRIPDLPERSAIRAALIGMGVPASFEELADELRVPDDALEALQRRVDAMERDGQIVRNRRGAILVAEKLDLIKGIVSGHPDGFGFVAPEDRSQDLFLSPREMQKVFHGDRVFVRVSGIDRRGRREAQIVEVIERGNVDIVGRMKLEHGVWCIAPEDRRISQELIVESGGTMGAEAGQVVVARIVHQPTRETLPVARVTEILGRHADPGMEIEIALRKHALPHRFPRDVEIACEAIPDEPVPADFKGRRDLRPLALVTIDGEDARDFDDAVFCEVLEGPGGGKPSRPGTSRATKHVVWLDPPGETDARYRLIVAIADVSHYVRHGDALDVEARTRGNSVYFPRRVLPMLPEALSNGLCSLKPDVDRLCMACDMRVSAAGDLLSYEFYPAVMRSQRRLTYTQAAAALEGKGGLPTEVLARLEPLHRLYKVLLQARERRGAIDFETIETRMMFGGDGKIESIGVTVRNDAHRLIEECMLAANVCASDYLQRNAHPALFRIHDGPVPEKLEALRKFLGEFGLQLSGGEKPKAADYARLLDRIRERPDRQLLQTVMLRSLAQAVYSPDNIGHFGLAYDSYAHFTSPIRRYADLVVHRSIKAVLAGKRHDPGDWHELGIHCSKTERRADEATRDVEAWLKCFYMRDRIGETYEATVTAATGFGIFVVPDELHVEGLVHVSELGNDYYHFDAARHQLLGERTGQRFRIGDRVRVELVRVDLEQSRIDFVLATPPAGRKARG